MSLIMKSKDEEVEGDRSVHQLAGTSGNEKGGLVLMKKGPTTDSDTHVFKMPAPRSSLLGLDKLAAAKRKKDEAEEDEPKKSKVMSYKGDDDDDDIEDQSDGKSDKSHQKDRLVNKAYRYGL